MKFGKYLFCIASVFILVSCAHQKGSSKTGLQFKNTHSTDAVDSLLFEKDYAYGIFINARAYELVGNYPAAIVCYEKVFEIDSSASAVREILLNHYISKGDISKALAISEKIYREDTLSLQNSLLYSRLLYKAGNPAAAFKTIFSSVKFNDSTPPESIEFLGLLSEETGNFPVAYNAWKFLSANPLMKKTATERLVTVLLKLGVADSAYAIASTEVRSGGYSHGIRIPLLKLAENPLYTDSIIVLYRLIDTDNAELQMQSKRDLAFLLARKEKLDDAEGLYREIAKESAVLFDLRTLGFFLFARNKFEEAESILVDVSNREPDADAFIYLGRVRLALGKTDSAQKAFLTAKTLRPAIPEPDYYIGYTYELKKVYDSAAYHFSLSYAIDTNHLETLFRLASANERSNNFLVAESLMLKVISSAPQFHTAKNYLAYMYAEKNVKIGEAEKLILGALAMDSLNSAYLDTYGWILYRKGTSYLDDALMWLEKADLLSNGKDTEIHEHLAVVYTALGMPDKARIRWQKVLELEPDNSRAKDELSKLD